MLCRTKQGSGNSGSYTQIAASAQHTWRHRCSVRSSGVHAGTTHGCELSNNGWCNVLRRRGQRRPLVVSRRNRRWEHNPRNSGVHNDLVVLVCRPQSAEWRAFSAENQFVIQDTQSFPTAIEAGFYSGYGEEIQWTNSMLPYSAYGNGLFEHDINSPLTPNKYIWIEVESHDNTIPWSSSSATVDTLQWTIYGGTYGVGLPRRRQAQGEIGHTTAATSWMGGGSGESFAEYWLDTSGIWHNWTSMAVCNDSPYWVSQTSGSQWSNGGY